MDLNNLSLLEKIGQKFILGVNSHNIDIIIEMIKKYYIGGVVLYKKNYSDYNEMLDVIKRLKEANSNNKIPLFIAIDQEGGRVNRMPAEFNNLKNIYNMSSKDIELMYSNGNITGKMLFDTGINMNFSPVLDIFDKKGSKILYKRCFCGDAQLVSDAGKRYIKGLNDNGIISVIKHFPGHGVSKMDSHFITPYVFDNKAILDKHIKPFENAIKNGVDALMVGHLVIRGMTGGLPASISSSFINKWLREKYNYDGLVITDEVNMLSRSIYRFCRLKKAFLSGSDIILIKLGNKDKNIIDKFLKIIKKDDKCIEMLDNSVKRIIKLKEKYNINDDISYEGCNIEQINREIDKINKMSM